MSYTTPHYYRKCEILWYDDYLANGPFNGQKKSDHFKWKGKHLQTKRLPQRIWRKFSFPPTSPHRPLDPSRDAVSRSKYRTELTNDHISEIYVCLSHCMQCTDTKALSGFEKQLAHIVQHILLPFYAVHWKGGYHANEGFWSILICFGKD